MPRLATDGDGVCPEAGQTVIQWYDDTVVQSQCQIVILTRRSHGRTEKAAKLACVVLKHVYIVAMQACSVVLQACSVAKQAYSAATQAYMTAVQPSRTRREDRSRPDTMAEAGRPPKTLRRAVGPVVVFVRDAIWDAHAEG